MLWKKALLSFALLLMGGVGSAIAQTGTITGMVTEASSGDALPGANVVIVDSQRGTSTDADGAFRIPGL